MSIRRAFRIPLPARAWAAAAALCLSACILGGTGTDTENGVKAQGNVTDPNALQGISARVLDSAGRPLRGVALAFFDPAYRPDLGQPPAAVVANPPESLVSDTGGYVRLRLKAAGKFVVEGISGGKTLFFDTLVVDDPRRAGIYPFRARPSRAFQGRVKLASGLRIDSGRVFLRGTGRAAKVDAGGAYDLGLLPADAERMALGVRFVSSPIKVLRAVPEMPASSVTDSVKSPAYACKALTTDSAAKTMAPAASGVQTGSTSLDTSGLATALKSCGQLEGGSVIEVTPTRTTGVPVTQAPGTPLLVLQGSDSTGYTSPKVLAPVVVPLGQCVPDLGKESTAYALDVQDGAASTDILVGDLSQACPSR
jgi:hypothetical protein